MHEVSLVHALFDHIDRAIGAHPPSAVRLVRVRIGAMSGVELTLFETAFEIVRADRGYPEAALVLVRDDSEALLLERLELEVRDG